MLPDDLADCTSRLYVADVLIVLRAVQVLKGQLAMLEPCISAAGFLYEEGEGLEPDELADNAAKLAKSMADLPGGGLGHGVCADISDQSQALSFQLNITHQVSLMCQSLLR